MNRNLLKTVIYDQHTAIKNFQIVDREYAFNMNVNYVLVGLRCAGKSTLLYKIVQGLIAAETDWNQIIYINFEKKQRRNTISATTVFWICFWIKLKRVCLKIRLQSIYGIATKALMQAAAAVKKAKKIFIITYDEKKELNVSGIKITVMPIWKWLIEN